MFYVEKRPTFLYRCTLVSLQVKKECLQIFRIINNSLHRCQGQNWKLGSCLSQAVGTLYHCSPDSYLNLAGKGWRGLEDNQRNFGPATGIFSPFTVKTHFTLYSHNQQILEYLLVFSTTANSSHPLLPKKLNHTNSTHCTEYKNSSVYHLSYIHN